LFAEHLGGDSDFWLYERQYDDAIIGSCDEEVFFSAVGAPVASRTEPPPALDEEAQAAFIAKSKALAPEYRTELLLP
jgi:hypothetical protein